MSFVFILCLQKAGLNHLEFLVFHQFRCNVNLNSREKADDPLLNFPYLDHTVSIAYRRKDEDRARFVPLGGMVRKY